MKTKEEWKKMQNCVAFQYRIAIYKNIQMDILDLKNKIEISISDIKIPISGFNSRLEKNERVVN